jgi:hypothetical protein
MSESDYRHYLSQKERVSLMPTNLRRMLRSLLKAKQDASSLELRFLREITNSLPPAAANGRRTATASSGRRTLKCPRCDRRFARPVHLGRHLSATHGRKMKRPA